MAQNALQSDRKRHVGRVILTSVQGIWAEQQGLRRYVSRHALNPSRRKRAPQGAGGVQAPVRRELQCAILHHQLGWQECQSISPSRVGGDRAQIGRGIQFQQVKQRLLKRTSYYGQSV